MRIRKLEMVYTSRCPGLIGLVVFSVLISASARAQNKPKEAGRDWYFRDPEKDSIAGMNSDTVGSISCAHLCQSVFTFF